MALFCCPKSLSYSFPGKYLHALFLRLNELFLLLFCLYRNRYLRRSRKKYFFATYDYSTKHFYYDISSVYPVHRFAFRCSRRLPNAILSLRERVLTIGGKFTVQLHVSNSCSLIVVYCMH